PQVEGMLHAADFVLDSKQYLAAVRIDDVLEPILMLIALLDDQALGGQPAVRTGEVVDVHLDMMLVVGLSRLVSFAEEQVLPRPGRHAGKGSACVLEPGRLRAHDLRIKARDALGRSDGHLELHVRNPDRHRAEAFGWSEAVNTVAPRAHPLYKTTPLREAEAGPAEGLAYPAETLRQGIVIGDHDPHVAAQNLGLAGGQMKLLAPRVHPHVGRTGH